MQLTREKGGRVANALGLMTATLLGVSGASAQDAGSTNINNDTSTDLGKTRIDTALLYYAEDGGRLKAIEPVAGVTFNASDGSTLNIKLTSDTLTGATPNGAAPWVAPQTFLTPARQPGEEMTTTNASGNSVIVTIPGTGTIASEYTTPANTLPLDHGFKDQRYAVDVGYSWPLSPATNVSVGGAYSTEHDYRSISINGGVSRDAFNQRTTFSASANIELDKSKPVFGTPTPLSLMSGEQKGPSDSKSVIGGVLGVTQVMNRYWLAQINYSIGLSHGYQTDPYRLISVVDGSTGAPIEYRYENRPRSRFRQSLYVGSKIAIGPTIADISGRIYRDDWGIKSITGEIADRVPINNILYVEPHVRYYSQSKANFFRDYLIAGQPLPEFASSDSRVGKFNATTIGAKVGVRLGATGELYVKADRYIQHGNSHPATAVGLLADQDLFTGVSATSIIVGYSVAFE